MKWQFQIGAPSIQLLPSNNNWSINSWHNSQNSFIIIKEDDKNTAKILPHFLFFFLLLRFFCTHIQYWFPRGRFILLLCLLHSICSWLCCSRNGRFGCSWSSWGFRCILLWLFNWLRLPAMIRCLSIDQRSKINLLFSNLRLYLFHIGLGQFRRLNHGFLCEIRGSFPIGSQSSRLFRSHLQWRKCSLNIQRRYLTVTPTNSAVTVTSALDSNATVTWRITFFHFLKKCGETKQDYGWEWRMNSILGLSEIESSVEEEVCESDLSREHNNCPVLDSFVLCAFVQTMTINLTYLQRTISKISSR